MELKLEKPFSGGINDIISKISRIAVVAAVPAIAAQAYSNWLLTNSIIVPINWAYSEILFFAGVIYIIALIFKKGIELQSENELTVYIMPIVVNLDVMMARRKVSLNELSERVDITIQIYRYLKPVKQKLFVLVPSNQYVKHSTASRPIF